MKLNDILKDFRSFAKSPYMDVKLEIDSMIEKLSNFKKKLALDSRYKESQQIEKAENKLINIKNDIDNNVIVKQKDLFKHLKSVYIILKKIKLDSFNINNLKLDFVKLPDKKDSVYIVEAPLLFITSLNNHEKQKLSELGIKNNGNYYYTKKIRFIVCKTNIENYKTQLNKYLTKVNRLIKNTVIPIHDINCTIQSKYIALLIPSIYAKYWKNVVGKQFQIYIK